MNPKFTLILPVYNSSEFLQSALSSIEAQTHENIELIAVDNESTDNSLQLLENHTSKFKYKYATAKNIYKHSWEEPVQKAFELMTGEWFTIIGSDDQLEPDYIENCAKIARSFGTYKILGNMQCFQSIIKKFGADEGFLQHRYKNLEEFKNLYLQKCPVNTPSVVYRESLRKHYKMNSQDYLGAGDYFAYGNFANEGILIQPVPFYLGYKYRVHRGQATWEMVKLGMDEKVQSYWRNKWTERT